MRLPTGYHAPTLSSLLTALIATLAIGCGLLEGDDRIEPDPNNGGGGTMMCSDNSDCEVDQRCADSMCEDHLSCSASVSEGCPDGTLNAVINGEEGCYAECDQGVCPGEQMCTNGICIGDGAVFSEGCVADWTTCSDSREYRVSCTDGTCACIINDVDVASFDTTTPCEDPAFHREVNEGCDWLVPEL